MSEMFVITLGVVLLFVLWWGLTVLPREEWQIMAALPQRKTNDERWRATNVTWYGFFTATAIVFALAVGIVLLAAMEMSMGQVLATALPLVLMCLPLSTLMALIVERQRHAFTVGGAVFCAFVLAPWVVALMNYWWGEDWPVPSAMAVLSVLAICYCYGEGLGRLACLSFGCCYGKPLSKLSSPAQKLFRSFHLRFVGRLKKASFEGGVEGEQLVPVQALTSAILAATALFSTWLFLHGHDTAAFLCAVVVSQSWRALSEFLRADFRGKGRVTAYQWMAISAIPYSILLAYYWREAAGPVADVCRGLKALWSPTLLLILQGLWFFAFYFYGKSTVTASEVTFFLVRRKQSEEE